MSALNIDSICSDIIEGLTYRQMATKYNTPLSTLHDFLSSSEHSARAHEARHISADSYADKAEQILTTCEGTKEEIARARELASHYRWMASKRRPATYGDKIDLTSGNEPIKQVFVIGGKEMTF